MKRLVEGLRHFQQQVFPEKRELFERLAGGQKPHTLFITCADSRVVPDLFTSAQPGDLFVIRNAGNIVPPFGPYPGGVTATIEFAVAGLEIRHIVVCGHSDCGAMKGLLHPESLAAMPAVASWVGRAEATRRIVLESYQAGGEPELVDALVRENVLVQLRNLQTHPSVASRVARGELDLYGWIYHIGTGEVESYDEAEQRYVRVDGDYLPRATPSPRLRAKAPEPDRPA